MPWCSNTAQRADIHDGLNLGQLKTQESLVRRRKREEIL